MPLAFYSLYSSSTISSWSSAQNSKIKNIIEISRRDIKRPTWHPSLIPLHVFSSLESLRLTIFLCPLILEYSLESLNINFLLCVILWNFRNCMLNYFLFEFQTKTLRSDKWGNICTGIFEEHRRMYPPSTLQFFYYSSIYATELYYMQYKTKV